MPRLSSHEMEEVLRERGHLARIATISADGAPSVVPVWFVHETGKILITPRSRSAFYANVRRDPRVAVTIDEAANVYRKVIVEGRAEILFEPGRDDEWRDIYRRIARRYVDDDAAEFYIQETIDQPRALIGIDLRTAKVTTWRMPKGDEPYTGIWASRYYEPGTKMSRQASGAAKGATGEKVRIR